MDKSNTPLASGLYKFIARWLDCNLWVQSQVLKYVQATMSCCICWWEMIERKQRSDMQTRLHLIDVLWRFQHTWVSTCLRCPVSKVANKQKQPFQSRSSSVGNPRYAHPSCGCDCHPRPKLSQEALSRVQIRSLHPRQCKVRPVDHHWHIAFPSWLQPRRPS